jgi:hypothetical protein
MRVNGFTLSLLQPRGGHFFAGTQAVSADCMPENKHALNN